MKYNIKELRQKLNTTILGIILLVTTSFSSCGDIDSINIKVAPPIEFTSLLKKRTVNLSNKIGESLSVKQNRDTVTYFFKYDKKQKTNTILDHYNDTIHFGTVTKYQNIYLLNEVLDNGNFKLSAFKLTDSTIIGLGDNYIFDWALWNEINTGFYHGMQLDPANPLVLTMTKKLAKSLFTNTLDSMTTRYLVQKKIFKNEYTQTDTINEKITEKPSIKMTANSIIYPNPVIDKLILKTNIRLTNQPFKIININGKIVISGVIKKINTEIDCANMLGGNYILNIPYSNESIKLVKN
jgi:hypothetical protein|tara:strand:+ start:17372 stop:18256 length:885 start_codon:yes stop_codon:yes gene_type:complete